MSCTATAQAVYVRVRACARAARPGSTEGSEPRGASVCESEGGAGVNGRPCRACFKLAALCTVRPRIPRVDLRAQRDPMEASHRTRAGRGGYGRRRWAGARGMTYCIAQGMAVSAVWPRQRTAGS